MRTIPERRSSSSEEPDMKSTSKTGAGQGLKVVSKSKIGRNESAFADSAFRSAVVLCAVAVLAIVALIVFELVTQSRLSMSKFGFKFLIKQIWDPVNEDFGALPFI